MEITISAKWELLFKVYIALSMQTKYRKYCLQCWPKWISILLCFLFRVGKDIHVNGKVAIDGVFLLSNDTFYESKYPAVMLDMHIIQISILYFQVSHFKDFWYIDWIWFKLSTYNLDNNVMFELCKVVIQQIYNKI